MLDDLHVMYYDSITRQAVHRSYDDSKHYNEEKSDAGVIFRDMYNDMKGRAFYLKEHLNHTDVLQSYLQMKKNNVMRKVKPRVRLMRKTLSDSQGLQISCLATGFYPRHINLTLFRDGQPVDDDQITGGEILPNGDGTYQMRKSLVISEEELHEEYKYNCTTKHLSLDNKLDITFVSDVAESDPGSFSQPVVFSVLMFMCGAVLIITALIIWRRRRAAGRGSEASQYKYFSTSCESCVL
ncbi:DLA class I histocompatibility antigen, A9/A9 alpha chain-like [Onychostoma macrolepis]|uniref:DLA class I histocompatibility antigen, A9/A9 alpha chain-like n=1 Tax=Onychostoma macrolepis TaxID=369639 RepID=UPI00272AB56D|nr:DLA class I histocompatibility antigen, A9/A9 alpha chain-like [Onychostoma macrolepis]